MAVKTPPEPASHDNRIVMEDVGWDLYERLLEIRGSRSMPRMTYFNGVLELITTSWDHERIRGVLASLVEAYMQEVGIRYGKFGNWTMRREEEEPKRGSGIEADECYQLGDDVRETRWPDLAIEVIWTSGGIDKLEVYRQFGVREVWFWDDGKLGVYVLGADGYEARGSSAVLPEIDLALLERLSVMPVASDAVAAFRASLIARRS